MEPATEFDVIREVLSRPTQSKRNIEERLRIFDEIPFLTDELRASHIRLVPEDPEPQRIDPELIRKASRDASLLSEPFRLGEVVYFNIFKHTKEIQLEKQSDHYTGLPVLEAIRQIGMALSHIVGDIPIDTRMALQDFSLVFSSYIEPEFPLVARAVASQSLGQDLSRDVTAFIDVRQIGITCVCGFSSGRLFDAEDRYQRVRGKIRDLHLRQAEDFAATVRGEPASVRA